MVQPIPACPASSEDYLLVPFTPDVLEKDFLQRCPTTVHSRGQSFYLIDIAPYTFDMAIELINNRC